MVVKHLLILSEAVIFADTVTATQQPNVVILFLITYGFQDRKGSAIHTPKAHITVQAGTCFWDLLSYIITTANQTVHDA